MASRTVDQAPTPKSDPSVPRRVEVWITPTVERNYEARGVFPKLRIKQALRIAGSGITGIFELPLDEAEKVLEDATAQRRDPALPRGAPKAFSALVERLKAAIKRAKGEPDDLPQARLTPLKPAPVSKEQAEKARAAAAAVELARDELAKQPDSREEFCRRAADTYWFGYGLLYREYMQPGYPASGYRFTNALQQRMRRVALDLYWEIRDAWKDGDDDNGGRDSCEVEFSRAHREKKLNEALAAAARANHHLQAMLVCPSQVSMPDAVE